MVTEPHLSPIILIGYPLPCKLIRNVWTVFKGVDTSRCGMTLTCWLGKKTMVMNHQRNFFNVVTAAFLEINIKQVSRLSVINKYALVGYPLTSWWKRDVWIVLQVAYISAWGTTLTCGLIKKTKIYEAKWEIPLSKVHSMREVFVLCKISF